MQPLTDFELVKKQIKEDFDYRWKEGTIRGWDTKIDANEIKKNPLYCV